MTHDKLTVGIEFHTAHCGLSDRRGWPDGAAPQTVVCPVLGTITKKSIGPIAILPNTGKYWPIPQYPNTGIVRTLVTGTTAHGRTKTRPYAVNIYYV